MGELVPFPKAHRAERGVLSCACPVGLDPAADDARPRFLAQPGCPSHGTTGVTVPITVTLSPPPPLGAAALIGITGPEAA